jgi:hypothetical protein
MRINALKISKGEFYRLGGFSHPRLFRKHVGRAWAYFMRHDI